MGAPVTKLDNSTTVRELMRPLDPILAPGDVTEIAINQPGEVWAMTNGEWIRHDVPMLSRPKLESLVNAIAVFNGLALAPKLSLVMPDGQRAEVTLPPACVDDQFGLNIRKHAQRSFSLEELDTAGVFGAVADASFNKPDDAAIGALMHVADMTRLDEREAELLRLKADGRWREFLAAAVRYKRNIIVAGKTGSGKTTFARALVGKIPTNERILTIEDVHEMILDGHPNKFHLLYSPSGGGQGRITAFAALMSCMRQSPDRILLAELRGNEAWEYVNSLNTGHPGSITTTHANSATHTYDRTAMLVKNSDAGRDLGIEIIRQVLYTTLEVVVYMENRRVVEVFYDPLFSKSKLAA